MRPGARTVDASVPIERGSLARADGNERFLLATRFLNGEAAVLDGRRLTDWLRLLTEDIEYKMPVRVTRERHAESDFSSKAFHFDEDRDTLETRVERFQTEHAWAEDPPSRTRRLVTNVVVDDVSEDEMDVVDYFLVYKARGDTTDYDLLVGEREDTLRVVDGQLRLARRWIYVDQTTLSTDSLSIFL